MKKITMCVTGLILFAFFATVAEEGEKTLKVTRGIVKLEKIDYRVFPGVKEVQTTQFGGIRFTQTVKSEKQGLALAKKIMNFYKGKKIGKHKLPAFKKISKPETTAWNSLVCTKNNEQGAQAVVKVSEGSVTTYLFPSCDESVLAHIL